MHAYTAGRIAALRGYPRTANPYTIGTSEYTTWNTAWDLTLARTGENQ